MTQEEMDKKVMETLAFFHKRDRIFKNPEEYDSEEHALLFTEQEQKDLSQSLRG